MGRIAAFQHDAEARAEIQAETTEAAVTESKLRLLRTAREGELLDRNAGQASEVQLDYTS